MVCSAETFRRVNILSVYVHKEVSEVSQDNTCSGGTWSISPDCYLLHTLLLVSIMGF